ncbi:methyltransferase family protein [Roseobacter sinensis]|uniref:Isoprenylcysteine carboxylmethyltransferase family protein n=1 Tax=Roseobacter sinensis TaxID=2931391 RepID=A0ABT3BLY7_9RHOB|nr:isoprenylcysteine carboxylmethyltransferase family protein [Roseobacter sp. WL0113]MCV3274214.1 isoprenylcysteine carboxylmethyltransferase family protein [Roseobacter sp. WL0113]
MKQFIFVYAIGCYGLFGIVFVWFAAFLLNVGDIRGPAQSPPAIAILVNLTLIAAFGMAHSVMARPAFKRIWIRIIPPAAERATYVLQSSFFLALIFSCWQPIPAVIWDISGPAAWIVYGVFFLGAAIILTSTFLLGHGEFVGLSQAWDNLRGVAEKQPQFRTPFLYRLVRHPLQFGLIVMMTATPVMTAGHLLFVTAMTLYITIGLRLEERALLREFGSDYEDYRRDVPMLIPHPFRRARRRATAE